MLYEQLLKFFKDFLADKSLPPLRGSGIYIKEGQLVFTLEGLFHHIDSEHSMTYPAFRQMIYQSQLNTDLAQNKGRVDILRSTGKVDQNWYCLLRLPDNA